MRGFILFFMVFVLFTSCETVVDVNLEEGDVTIVSEAYIDFSDTSDYGIAHVYLTESAPYFSDVVNPPLSGAIITINDTYILEESLDSVGYYYNAMIPKSINDTFELKIIADINDKQGEWVASDVSPIMPIIDSIYSFYEEGTFPRFEDGYFVNIVALEPGDDMNFYHLDVQVADTMSFHLDPGSKRSVILTDEFVNGMALDFTVNDEPFNLLDTVQVTLSSISENTYYYYFNLYTLLTETSGIGAAPPFGLNGNVISQNENFNNSHGNFVVRNRAVKEIVITK